MKKKIGKELISFIVYIVVGLFVGLLWAVLERVGAIPSPVYEREIEMWVIGVIIGIALALVVGGTITFELIRKTSKKYAIEEKDERHQAIFTKSCSTAWRLNIFVLAMLGAGMLTRGYPSEIVLLFGVLVAFNIASMLVMIVYYYRKM
ncbi:MAG: hypothetical protein FWF81_03070 [Defluviitaleaceae bacterium]|nr:hypothetical protein [Defluviitaleaceae bacterium]